MRGPNSTSESDMADITMRDAPPLGPLSDPAGAVPVRERIAALDVLRGFAIAGILFANVLGMFGLVFMPPERVAALPNAAADHVATLFEHVFIAGKFYSIFSLLFGIGFGVQLARGGDAMLPRFKRRLRILLGIGTIHALFIWSGDILMLYALLGFALPWFAKKTERELLRWAALLLASPTVLYLLALLGMSLFGSDSPPTTAGAGFPPEIVAVLEALGTGGIVESFRGNLLYLALRWFDLFATVRFPKVLGMFVLGLWMVRTGIALAPGNHRETLERWSRLGLGLGLPANLIATWVFEQWPYYSTPSLGGLLGVVMQAIGVPLLALGYAATVALLVVDGRRIVNLFAPVGRMALTNYLMHSVVCVTLSYGFGFGLWWRIGATTAMGIAFLIVLVQIPLSAWWLSRARFGPVEWIWRRLTYGRPI